MVTLNATKAHTKAVSSRDKALADATADVPEISQEQLEQIGTASDSLEYVGELVHPTKRDARAPRKSSTGDPVKMPEARSVVGYAFKVLKPVDVPDFGPLKGRDIYSYTPGRLGNTKHLNPGETWYATLIELGALAARPEFGGRITGGEGKDVTVTIRVSDAKARDGVAKADTELPHPLVKVENSAVNRSVEFEIPVGREAGVTDKGKKQAAAFPEGEKPEFDKWRSLFVNRRTVNRSASATKEARDPRKDFVQNQGFAAFARALQTRAQKEAASAQQA